jgi:hypothetical protein
MLSPMLNVLYLHISTSRSLCAVPNRALVLQFLHFVLPRYVALVLSEWLLNGSGHPYYYGITLAFTFHMDWISVMRSSYFKIFSSSFFITFLSPEIATYYIIIIIIIIIIITSNQIIGMKYRKITWWIRSLGISYNLGHFKNKKLPAITSKNVTTAGRCTYLYNAIIWLRSVTLRPAN